MSLTETLELYCEHKPELVLADHITIALCIIYIFNRTCEITTKDLHSIFLAAKEIRIQGLAVNCRNCSRILSDNSIDFAVAVEEILFVFLLVFSILWNKIYLVLPGVV